MEIAAANEATSELSRVEEELCSALQEIKGLHDQIGKLLSRDKQLKNHLHFVQVLAENLKMFAEATLAK